MSPTNSSNTSVEPAKAVQAGISRICKFVDTSDNLIGATYDLRQVAMGTYGGGKETQNKNLQRIDGTFVSPNTDSAILIREVLETGKDRFLFSIADGGKHGYVASELFISAVEKIQSISAKDVSSTLHRINDQLSALPNFKISATAVVVQDNEALVFNAGKCKTTVIDCQGVRRSTAPDDSGFGIGKANSQYLKVTKISLQPDSVIIVGSDGLFSSLSGKEISSIVKDCLERGKSGTEIAQALKDEVVRRGDAVDCTTVVVYIHNAPSAVAPIASANLSSPVQQQTVLSARAIEWKPENWAGFLKNFSAAPASVLLDEVKTFIRDIVTDQFIAERQMIMPTYSKEYILHSEPVQKLVDSIVDRKIDEVLRRLIAGVEFLKAPNEYSSNGNGLKSEWTERQITFLSLLKMCGEDILKNLNIPQNQVGTIPETNGEVVTKVSLPKDERGETITIPSFKGSNGRADQFEVETKVRLPIGRNDETETVLNPKFHEIKTKVGNVVQPEFSKIRVPLLKENAVAVGASKESASFKDKVGRIVDGIRKDLAWWGAVLRQKIMPALDAPNVILDEPSRFRVVNPVVSIRFSNKAHVWGTAKVTLDTSKQHYLIESQCDGEKRYFMTKKIVLEINGNLSFEVIANPMVPPSMEKLGLTRNWTITR